VQRAGSADGVPAINALGERRGLLAFKIMAVGADPDGPGSVLPNLVIEVCDPSEVSLSSVEPGPGVSGDYYSPGGVVETRPSESYS
jgi:hypothetical protein